MIESKSFVACLRFAIALASAGFLASPIHADQISLAPASVIGGSGAWDTRDWNDGQFQAGYVADNQSSTAIPEPDQAPDDANGGFWLGKELDEEEFFVLDLGQLYFIDQIDLFQTHNATFDDRSTNGYEVYGSQAVAPLVSGEMGASGSDLVDPVLLGSGILARQLVADDPIEPESPALTENGPFQFIRFNTVGPFHDVPDNAQRSVGLNEIQLFGTPIPEPATFVLALIAAGGVALAVVRQWRRACGQ